jgi:MoaA/NifB/PqqE/SkfB family radical SAM enzyme
MLMFHITTRCDMECKHCGDDIWGDPKDDLTLEEIEEFSRGMGEFVDLGLGGGEPFLRKDLVEICAIFVRQNKVRNIGIPSNGFATGRIVEKAREILERCPETTLNIMLSLDGFQPTHDEIRRPGSYERVLATARRLKELQQEHDRLNLSFNATINNENWQELPDLARFLQDEFQANLDFNVLTGDPRDPKLVVPAPEILEETIEGIYAVRETSPLTEHYLRICQDVIVRTNAEDRQVVPCRAGSLIGTVHANGDVRVCPYLPLIGNVRERPFREIWQSERALAQHRSISAGDCSCNSDCFIVTSLNHYWKLPLMVLHEKVMSKK